MARKQKPRPAPARGPVSGLPSDQAPGEEVVQVNDAYIGEDRREEVDPIVEDQHPTGG